GGAADGRPGRSAPASAAATSPPHGGRHTGSAPAAPVPPSPTAAPGPTATTGPTAPTRPTGPADLTWSAPERKATDRRWCEDVTLAFTDSGGEAVRSGTVTFGTHIIGALGIDWATVTSQVPLPTPIGAGARVRKTWTVCVDAWRVPLGMHVETRDVSVRWK
ncbi:hypothetical protein, partial [Streptomyces sediminimaris]